MGFRCAGGFATRAILGVTAPRPDQSPPATFTCPAFCTTTLGVPRPRSRSARIVRRKRHRAGSTLTPSRALALRRHLVCQRVPGAALPRIVRLLPAPPCHALLEHPFEPGCSG